MRYASEWIKITTVSDNEIGGSDAGYIQGTSILSRSLLSALARTC